MRARRVFVWVLGALLLPPIALVVTVQFLDFNRYRSELEDLALNATG